MGLYLSAANPQLISCFRNNILSGDRTSWLHFHDLGHGLTNSVYPLYAVFIMCCIV